MLTTILAHKRLEIAGLDEREQRRRALDAPRRRGRSCLRWPPDAARGGRCA